MRAFMMIRCGSAGSFRLFYTWTLVSVPSGEFDVLVDHGNEATHNVETIITHNNYKPKTYHNDIALIKLATPIKFSRYILPACIPEPDFAEKVKL